MQTAGELLERESLLAALGDAADAAARGDGRTVLVSGEAGIGKTSLLERFAAGLGRGRVLWGACEALATPRPLGPLHDIAGPAGAALRGALARPGDRAALFAAVLDELARPPAPTVVVFEDVHWADDATLDLVKYLGRRIRHAGALLVLSHRDDAASLDKLRAVLGDLPSAHVARLQVPPLSRAAVERLAAVVARRDAGGVHAATGGNAFFVTEVLRQGGAAAGVPASVRDAVLARAALEVELASDRDDDVGLRHHRAAHRCDDRRMVIGDEAAAFAGVEVERVQPLEQAEERRAGAARAATADDERAPGRPEQLDRALDRVGVGEQPRPRRGAQVLGEAERGGHFCAQHVDREVEERRPRLAAVAERAGARLVELLQDETAEAFRDGWCSVGDMAGRDDDGYIRLVDRKSNMIISGGENVYPSEVEAVIGSHPQVEDVAVIGLPDAKWGEAVCAVVVVRAGGALSEDAVVAWCRERMAGYKRPRSVVFMAAAEMPRTATGKILHRTLRERLAAKAEGR